jgi:hypothetical protein
MDDASIDNFLGRIKAEDRSSPAGQHWAAFHELLCSHARRLDVRRPPMPLILAASGESDSSKYRRLAEQLHWAQANGVLAEALRFLTDLAPDQWNEGSTENWHRTFY